MGNLSTQIYAELKGTSPSAFHVLLVFLSLVIAFGILSSNHPNLWGAFLPTLLMGLSYGVISLSLDGLFREDWNDGTIEWWVSEGKSLEVYAVIKILSHWIRLGIPLAGIAGVITGFQILLSCFWCCRNNLDRNFIRGHCQRLMFDFEGKQLGFVASPHFAAWDSYDDRKYGNRRRSYSWGKLLSYAPRGPFFYECCLVFACLSLCITTGIEVELIL